MTPLTVIHHDAPNPVDVDQRHGWCGATAAVIGGTATGEVWEFHDTDGTVTRGAELTIAGGYSDAGRLRCYDAATLRELAAVATELADQLDSGATP